MSDDIFYPIEGKKDCKHYHGFVGVIMFKGQTFGLMRCYHNEYLNCVAGAKDKLGGIGTWHCEHCTEYEKEEGGAS